MIAELLGLLVLLEGVIGCLALLEGGLNHVVPHARRSDRSAEYLQAGRLERQMGDGWLLLVGMEYLLKQRRSNMLDAQERSAD